MKLLRKPRPKDAATGFTKCSQTHSLRNQNSPTFYQILIRMCWTESEVVFERRREKEKIWNRILSVISFSFSHRNGRVRGCRFHTFIGYNFSDLLLLSFNQLAVKLMVLSFFIFLYFRYRKISAQRNLNIRRKNTKQERRKRRNKLCLVQSKIKKKTSSGR